MNVQPKEGTDITVSYEMYSGFGRLLLKQLNVPVTVGKPYLPL